jgi:hypothetical protein
MVLIGREIPCVQAAFGFSAFPCPSSSFFGWSPATPDASAGEWRMPHSHTAGKSSRWSGRVTRESHALALKKGIFAQSSPRKIAASLKRSAEHSKARKSSPYRSAMSMLVFYINRAGGNLSARRRKILENAKVELRKLFHKE